MYRGPPIDDNETFRRLDPPHQKVLQTVNGYIAFRGGLHVRGACHEPKWHSLREAWFGRDALHRLFPQLTEDDVPFAQDALGDQYLIRAGAVIRLLGETGEIEELGIDLEQFDANFRADPVEYLSLQPLLQFEDEGGVLAPGFLLMAYPPFCTAESGDGVVLSAVPADERLRFLSEFSRQIASVEDGASVIIRVVD